MDNLEFSSWASIDNTRLSIQSEYFQMILRVGRCEVQDAYRFCLRNITRDPIEFYPHEVQIVLDIENVCNDSCTALGFACETNRECASHYCVHGICRNQPTWCGDGVCDPGEEDVCPQDCPTESTQEEQEVAEEESLIEAVIEEEFEDADTVLAEEEVVRELSDDEVIVEQRRILGLFTEQEIREAISTAQSDVNWPAAVIVLGVGSLLILILFRRHRHATI